MTTKATRWQEKIQLFSIVISSIALLFSALSIFLTTQIFRHQQIKDSADLVLKFDDDLNKPKFVAITDSLDTDDIHAKILKSNGGVFTEEQVDDYLSQYETLAVLYKENLINKEMANQVFSYDIEKANQNLDIQQQIKDESKSDSDLWTGFLYLAKEFK
jgi:hypothetical protein